MKQSTTLYDKIFKTAMTTAVAASAITAVAPEATKANTIESVFKDVKASSDYYKYVNELFERGFVSGYPDGSFKPTGLLTRAEAAKILALNLGLDVTKQFDITFKDLPKENWAYPYIAALKEAGILHGYPDGTFKPNTPITRDQIAKIIVSGYKLQITPEITLPFSDVSKTDWAAPYIQTLFDLGITSGQTATTYGGNATASRANMAAFTIRAEMTTDYRNNRRSDENVITSIDGNKMTIGGQVYYIKEELQPLLHVRNLATLNEADLDFIKIGTKIVGIRNLELLNGGTADSPLTLDLAGSTVKANITIAGDYIKLANANITGDITIKKGDQKQIELNGLDLIGRLIIEGEAKRDQESVINLTNTTVDEMDVNRDETKIITDNSTPTIKVGNNVSEIEITGKINAIDFVGNQDVFVKRTVETNKLTIEAPIKVTLENKAQLPQVEIQQYGSQLIVPKDSTIGMLIKPDNIKPEEAVKLPTGGLPTIDNVKDTSDVVRPPIPPSTGGGDTGGSQKPFVSQINNSIANDGNSLGLVGTEVISNNPDVAAAQIENGKIKITSYKPGVAKITVKDGTKEAVIDVNVAADGSITITKVTPYVETFTSQTDNTIANTVAILGTVGQTVNTTNATVATATIEEGKVKITSHAPGKATITVTNGQEQATIDVNVAADGRITITKVTPYVITFTSQTDNTTANTVATLGTIGQAVNTTNATVATATIEDGKVKITSHAPGKATITVTNGQEQATIDVNVAADGSITITKVTPYVETFTSQTLTTHNTIDANHEDELAVGMIGTSIDTSNATVATATLVDGEINITSKGVGTAIITVKENAPSLKEAQIIVTVDASGKIAHTIKRPIEVAQDKIMATPTPAAEDLKALYEAVDIKGITAASVADVTTAIKTAIAENGKPLTEKELKLTVDIALLSERILMDNPGTNKISTKLDLQATGLNDTTFTWKSVTTEDSATVNLTNGEVTRSANDDIDDTVKLSVTAKNGTETKDATIDVTILENKAPYLVSAILKDKDNDGDTSVGDHITFKFSEPVNMTSTTPQDIAKNVFGADAAFGDNATVTWSGDKTELIVTTGESAEIKVDSTITIKPSSVKDANGNEVTTTNIVKLENAPIAYTIVKNNLTGDFKYEGTTIISEAEAQIKGALTFKRNDIALENATFSYDATDVASGSIESGVFTLKSVTVKEASGKETKMVFKEGETLSVNTSDTLKVKDATEVKNGIDSAHVKKGYVKTIKVDDTVSETIVVAPPTIIKNPITIDGKDKLEFTVLQVNSLGDAVKLNNLTVKDHFDGGSWRYAISTDAKNTSALELEKVKIIITPTQSRGASSGGISLNHASAKLTVKDSTIEVELFGNYNHYYALGIEATKDGADIQITNSQISSTAVQNGNDTIGYTSYGIKTGDNANVRITDSTVAAKTADAYVGSTAVYGIRLGNSSNLTMTGINEIIVGAKNADGFGIGNNEKYASINVSETTTFTLDNPATDKKKANYEFAGM